MANDLTPFAADLNRLASALGGSEMESVMTKLGVEAKKDATAAARRDLGGDARFSGWPKAELAARFDHNGPGSITILPTPRSRGPWVVAEFGRKAGRKATRRGSRRIATWGATRGKSTWSDAVAIIERETPDRAMDALVHVVKGILGG